MVIVYQFSRHSLLLRAFATEAAAREGAVFLFFENKLYPVWRSMVPSASTWTCKRLPV
jgi:hypothetical protein